MLVNSFYFLHTNSISTKLNLPILKDRGICLGANVWGSRWPGDWGRRGIPLLTNTWCHFRLTYQHISWKWLLLCYHMLPNVQTNFLNCVLSRWNLKLWSDELLFWSNRWTNIWFELDKKRTNKECLEYNYIYHIWKLFFRFRNSVLVTGVNDKDETLCVLEVVPPQRSDLVLTSYVPHSEADVLVFDSLHIEAYNTDLRNTVGSSTKSITYYFGFNTLLFYGKCTENQWWH